MNLNRWTKLAPSNDPGISPDAIDLADLLSIYDAAEQTGISVWKVREMVRVLGLGRGGGRSGSQTYLNRNDVERIRVVHLRGHRDPL